MNRIALAVLVVVLAVHAAAAETARKDRPRNPTAAAEQQPGQIACGKYGCQRIPPNCHPEQSYYWNGMPSGYDKIVCR